MNLFVRAATIATLVLSIGTAPSVIAGGAPAAPKEHIVEITGFKFIPESLKVNAGDTVTWINKDIAPHTATADNATFDTGELKRNESGSFTFSSAQTITYFCRFHPMMKASMQVE